MEGLSVFVYTDPWCTQRHVLGKGSPDFVYSVPWYSESAARGKLVSYT